MKNSLSVTEISTFAKHMICPPGLIGLTDDELKEKGLKDFSIYPFSEARQRSTVNSDPDLLLNNIIDALKRSLTQNKIPVLLLSDGKDSMTLALALSKMKIKCLTLTLLRRNDSQLRSFVKDKAELLGHTPYFVDVNDVFKSYDQSYFLNACKQMKHPVLDQGFLFFLFGIRKFFELVDYEPAECLFIDGLGNDEHLGYLPSRAQRRAFNIAQFGGWRILPDFVPWLRWYLRSPAEANGDLSAMACFFAFKKALKLNRYFDGPRVATEQDFVDFRAFSRGNFHDHQCMIQKTVVAANAIGSDIIYPWTDPLLAHYCFNLPPIYKYDFSARLNKICLRNLLNKELSWMQEKRGVDLFFDAEYKDLINILNSFVSPKIGGILLKKGFLPKGVRQRALLELLNLCGFLTANGHSSTSIEEFLCEN